MYTYTKCHSCPFCAKITITVAGKPLITIYGDYEDVLIRKVWIAKDSRSDLAVRSILTWL
jgi:hypothetical protein